MHSWWEGRGMQSTSEWFCWVAWEESPASERRPERWWLTSEGRGRVVLRASLTQYWTYCLYSCSPFSDFSKTYTVVLAKIINKLKMTDRTVSRGKLLYQITKLIDFFFKSTSNRFPAVVDLFWGKVNHKLCRHELYHITMLVARNRDLTNLHYLAYFTAKQYALIQL